MKIAFFDRAFTENKGGIERVCSGLVWEMTFRGHQCVVFAANKDTDMPAAFPVPESTKIIAISINTSEEGRRELESKVLGERPDVFVIMTGLAGDIPLWCLLSLKNAKIPLVASEHGCPEFIEQSWDRHQRLVYLNSVDCIHLLLDSYRKSLPEFLQDRVTVIPNPVNPMPVQDPSKDGPTAEKIIIAPLCQDRCRLSLRDFVLSSGAKENDGKYEHQVFQRVQGQPHRQDAATA